MNRLTLALLTALEAVVIVAIGVAVPLLIGGIVWGTELGFAGDLIGVWRGAADTWLLGHGVPLTIGLDAATMTRLGVPASLGVLVLSVPPLAFALGTFLAAMRTGRRCVDTQWTVVVPVGTAVVAASSVLLAMTASVTGAGPSIGWSLVLPAASYLLGVTVGVARRAVDGDIELGGVAGRLRDRVVDLVPPIVPALLRAAARSGGLFLLIMTGLAALGFTLALLGGYSTIVSLYESTEYGVLGGIAITLVHLAYLPTLLVWSGSWLLGPGFAIGSGSIVSPVATQLGPLPAVPVFGAIPQWNAPLGLLVVLLPVAAAAVAAAYGRRRAEAEDPEVFSTVRNRLIAVAVAAAGSGLVVLLLTLLASGSIGPGVLTQVGPAPFAVAGAAVLAVLAGGAVAWAGPSSRDAVSGPGGR